MEVFSLLRDFALIMVVAGGVTILLRKLHPPIVLCYLLAGVIISPYILPLFSTTDVHTIGLLAEYGLILLLFGVGLEFGWSKIRQIGLTALIIGGVEIITMICLGYGLGRLLGWSKTDALFLGAALHTSSSAIIVKLLKDMGKLNLVSSRVIVGILVIEDFAAVVIIAVLSGVTNTTGIADFNVVLSLALLLLFFILGKIMANTIAAILSGYDARTSLQVGLGMPQMGEFSLAIGKIGIERGITVAPVYPIIAVATTLTSFAAPYLTRSTDSLINFIGRKLPRNLNTYLSHLDHWGQTVRKLFSQQGEEARKIQKSGRTIILNCLILIVIIGTGTFALQFVETLASHLPVRLDITALLLGFTILVLCLPSLILIWRNLMTLIDEVTRQVFKDTAAVSKAHRRETLRTVLRNSITAILSIILLLWLIPLVSQLLFIGSLALAIPALLLAFILYLVVKSIRGVHTQMESTFSQVFMGEPGASSAEGVTFTRTHQSLHKRLTRKIKRFISRERKRRLAGRDKN